jgi:hypothetical protein
MTEPTGPRGRHAQPLDPRVRKDPVSLDDDTWLTQYGEDGQFTDRLREHNGETEVSLIFGALDADAAALFIAKYLTPFRCVRHTQAGWLRGQGFRVVHSPSKSNRLHVSVYPPEADDGDPAEWDERLAGLFNSCFTEHTRGGRDDERT